MVEKDSLNDTLWINIARLYRLNQQYKQSIDAYKQAIKINPENKKNILALAKTNMLAGNKNKSIALYKEFLLLDPHNIMALSDLAHIYSTDNLFDSAANIYKKLYFLDNSNVAYLQKWANNQWFAGDYNEAFKNYKKAYNLDSTYLPVVYDLSRIYINNKMQDSAISILDMNIKKYPDESKLYADLGNAYFSKGDYFFAIPPYEKAIELHYNGQEIYKRLAISYYSMQKFQKSKYMFESLIIKDTNDYKVCMYLGNIYTQLNDPKKGLVFFNKTIELLTPDPMIITAIYSGMADSYHATEDYTKQINCILKRQEHTPAMYNSPQYLLEIAEIYELNLKDLDNALEFYKKYYSEIEKISWFKQENKDIILSKIRELDKNIQD
jgi:tetratricopeptide (TPR) repeat protein